MPIRTVHRIKTQDVQAYLTDHWDNMSASTTEDGTQRKHLDVAVGEVKFRVTRQHFRFVEGLWETDPWETLYEGGNLEEAVRIYNQLG